MDQFTYLGIQIGSKLAWIVKINYVPLMEEITKSINRWINLPLSLIGRINIIKMNLIPKILYIFQNVPLPPPDEFFSEDKKVIHRIYMG